VQLTSLLKVARSLIEEDPISIEGLWPADRTDEPSGGPFVERVI
jgi:hypothetical protein